MERQLTKNKKQMEHVKKYWLAYALLIIAIIVVAMNWTKWFGTEEETKIDGTGCVTDDNRDGIYANGVCTATGGPRPFGPNGGSGGGVGETERLSKTYCAPRQPGATCQPRVYVNGHWYSINTGTTTSTQCCYNIIS